MQYIPPEMREDTGEIEAALAGKLPKLLELKDIKGDLHVHSSWSDGQNTIEQMARAAKALGYEYIASADHSPSVGIAGGLTPENLERKIEEVAAVNEVLEGFTVLVGTEVDIRADGRLDYPDDLLAKCDVVVASVHMAQQQKERTITGRIISAIENKNVDIIAHPTGRIIGKRDPYEVDMQAVLEAAARNGTAMEINAYPNRLDLNDVWTRTAKDLGVKLSIDSDAHAMVQLKVMKYGVTVARRGWLEKGDVLNTMGLQELMKVLRHR
jgi:DNA polymerase (family X)